MEGELGPLFDEIMAVDSERQLESLLTD